MVAAALVLFALGMRDGVGGGISLVGAERVLEGDVPYRDFWTIYAPGHFYLLAGLFAVFGRHVLVSAVASSILCALSAGLVHRVALGWTRRLSHALGTAAVFVAAMVTLPYYRALTSYPPALFCLLLALYLVTLHLLGGRRGALFGAGVAVGAAVLFKHDVGAYTALAIAAGLATRELLGAGSLAGRARSIVTKLLVLGGGVLVPVAPVTIVLGVAAGADLVQDLIVFPATDFRYTRPEQYPSLWPRGLIGPSIATTALKTGNYLTFLMPLAVWLGSLVLIGWDYLKSDGFRRVADIPARMAATALFSAGFLLHYMAAHVQVNTHIVSMTVYAVLVGTLAAQRWIGSLEPRRARWAPSIAMVVLACWVGALGVRPVYVVLKPARHESVTLELPKVGGAKMREDQAAIYAALARWVERQVPPGRPIFVGKERTDIVISSSDTVLYFVLDRPPATRYQELHPGIADTAAVQAEMIDDLERRQVPLLVLREIVRHEPLDEFKRDLREHLPEVGSTALDDYIREHYRRKAVFGRLAVWLRD